MKKTNNKAFTLMELLAVIVILAILALIVTPIIINIINKSQQGSDERSLARYAEVVKQGFFETKLEDSSLTFEEYITSDVVASIAYTGSKIECEQYIQTPTNDLELKKCTVDGRGYYNYVNGEAKKTGDKPADKDNNTNNEQTPEEDDTVIHIPEVVPDECFFVIESYDGNLSIEKYVEGCSRNVIIPSQIGGKTVKYILDQAFFDIALTSVEIPDSVTSIGEYAFADNSLRNVVIPNSVKIIYDCAFIGNKLISVTIGNSVTSIGNYAFSSSQLKSVTINNSQSNVTFGADVFDGFEGNIIWNY